MICPAGHANDVGANFCSTCGAFLTERPATVGASRTHRWGLLLVLLGLTVAGALVAVGVWSGLDQPTTDVQVGSPVCTGQPFVDDSGKVSRHSDISAQHSFVETAIGASLGDGTLTEALTRLRGPCLDRGR